ncbi:Hsp20/alpha crystallin family protein [Noviherbaspirillum aridicola]|nr:Hsp20/alpha crystallin family protein [Noviherbaspirillum aridicola]
MNDTTELARSNARAVPSTPDDGERRDEAAALAPAVDVIEDGAGITLIADMPGVPKDRLGIHLEADKLSIEGEMALDLPQDMASRFAEVKMPRYRRSFTLSNELDPEKASAELKNGVLTLRIPKAAHVQPRRIEISAG